MRGVAQAALVRERVPMDGTNTPELDDNDVHICNMLWLQHMDMFRGGGFDTIMHGILYLMWPKGL